MGGPTISASAARQAMSATQWRWPARRRPKRQWSKPTPDFRSFGGRLHAVLGNFVILLFPV